MPARSPPTIRAGRCLRRTGVSLRAMRSRSPPSRRRRDGSSRRRSKRCGTGRRTRRANPHPRPVDRTLRPPEEPLPPNPTARSSAPRRGMPRYRGIPPRRRRIPCPGEETPRALRPPAGAGRVPGLRRERCKRLRETIAAVLVWLLALAVVIAIVVLETIPSGSAHNAEGGSTSSTGATSPSSPTMTYSPVNWPTKVPSPSPAPGADGVTKVNGLDVTYLGVNLDATSQVAPYGNVPDYGKKVVGIKLRVKNSKDSSITMIGYQDGFHVVLHLNVGSERSRSRDKGPDALWDGSSLPSGQTKEGWVYVEVPQEYKGGYLSYETIDDIDTSILVQ